MPKKVLREVPVCTLVLAAKSEYFRILFTGRFAESARRERVDIHVPEGGQSQGFPLSCPSFVIEQHTV